MEGEDTWIANAVVELIRETIVSLQINQNYDLILSKFYPLYAENL